MCDIPREAEIRHLAFHVVTDQHITSSQITVDALERANKNSKRGQLKIAIIPTYLN